MAWNHHYIYIGMHNILFLKSNRLKSKFRRPCYLKPKLHSMKTSNVAVLLLLMDQKLFNMISSYRSSFVASKVGSWIAHRVLLGASKNCSSQLCFSFSLGLVRQATIILKYRRHMKTQFWFHLIWVEAILSKQIT